MAEKKTKKTKEVKEAKVIGIAIPSCERNEGETPKEFGNRLQELSDNFKEELQKVTDEETLKALEDNVVKQLDDFDEVIKNRKYELPKNVTFNGKTSDRKQIGMKIVHFINQKEVQWQLCLGMWQLVKFWLNADMHDTVTYGIYDSTLRTLGDCKFKGAKEWEDILTINDYFTQCNDQYAIDSTTLIFLSTVHSNILERIQMLTPVDQLMKGE